MEEKMECTIELIIDNEFRIENKAELRVSIQIVG